MALSAYFLFEVCTHAAGFGVVTLVDLPTTGSPWLAHNIADSAVSCLGLPCLTKLDVVAYTKRTCFLL